LRFYLSRKRTLWGLDGRSVAATGRTTFVATGWDGEEEEEEEEDDEDGPGVAIANVDANVGPIAPTTTTGSGCGGPCITETAGEDCTDVAVRR